MMAVMPSRPWLALTIAVDTAGVIASALAFALATAAIAATAATAAAAGAVGLIPTTEYVGVAAGCLLSGYLRHLLLWQGAC